MRECLIKAIALSLLYNLVLGSFFLDEAARMRMLTHAPLQMTSKPDLGNSHFDILGESGSPTREFSAVRHHLTSVQATIHVVRVRLLQTNPGWEP